MQKLAQELSALSVFRGLLQKAPMQALLPLLRAESLNERLFLLGEFVSHLAEDDYSFSAFLHRALYEDENPYVVGVAQKRPLPEFLVENAKAELKLLSRLGELDAPGLCGDGDYSGYLPRFHNEPMDLQADYEERLQNIHRYGYGLFASAAMFRVENGQLLPVHSADPIDLSRFVGYESERRQIFANTKALVEGRPAANVLLFGDAGTGKSSTVKACVNHFAGEGLRLIELRKDQLFSLSQVMESIAGNPLKFILFIDDLSFNRNDDSFSMLKAVLEGSASARADNAVIYATSNRRHIIKEKFSDRGEDDVHRNDTVQELMSLSDRFGLTVYFEKPGKSLYLDIVRALAQRRGLQTEPKQLELAAEAFALRKGSRSPRAAEQFVDSLCTE